MTKRVLIVMTSHATLGNTGKPTGAYVPEIAHPAAVFADAGLQVEFASIQGGRVPLYGLDATDPVSVAFLKNEATMARLHDSVPMSAVDPSRYAAIFFAGGHGTMWDFADDAALQRVAVAIYEAGGVVSAVCHGPAALVNLRLRDGSYLVAGKDVSAFTNEEETAVGLDGVVPFLLQARLEERGAKHSGAPKWQQHVVTSGRLVTGQNPASASGVAKAVLGVLQSNAG